MEFFDLIESLGLSLEPGQGKLNTSRLMEISSGKLGDFVKRVSDQLPQRGQRATSPFDFSSSTYFVGGPNPCASPRCRQAAVDELARFACLYADHVELPNPFQRFIGLTSGGNSAQLARELAIYISTLGLLRPLIAKGLISFGDSPVGQICEHCLIGSFPSIRPVGSKSEKTVFEYLESRFSKEVVVQVEERSFVKVSGPEDLIPHGSYVVQLRRLEQFFTRNGIKVGQTLTMRQIKRSGLFTPNIAEILFDLRRLTARARISEASYLTQRPIEHEMISMINGVVPSRRVRKLTPMYHRVPVIEDVPIAKILRLREREGAAFQTYCSVVSESLTKSKGESAAVQEQIFNDLIRPELIKLNSAISKSRKLLLKSLSQDLALAAGSLTVGFLGHAFPADLRIGTSVGGVYYTKRFLHSMSELIGEPTQAIRSPYYFLWKLSRTTNRGRALAHLRQNAG